MSSFEVQLQYSDYKLGVADRLAWQLRLYGWNYVLWLMRLNIYCTRAIITRRLYIFYPIFQCGLQSRAVNTTDNLCTKQGNAGLYNQERFQIKSGIWWCVYSSCIEKPSMTDMSNVGPVKVNLDQALVQYTNSLVNTTFGSWKSSVNQKSR